MGVKPDSGTADPAAAVTWPDTATLMLGCAPYYSFIMYSYIMFKGCDSRFFELCKGRLKTREWK